MSTPEYDAGYAQGWAEAEEMFRRILERSHLIARPPTKARRQQLEKRKKRGPNPKLQKPRKPRKQRICEVCGREFKYPSELVKHMKSHESRTYVCNLCGEEFEKYQLLASHTRWNKCKGVA